MMIDSLAIHQSTLEAVASECITYSRGSESFTTVAVIGRRKPDTEDGQQRAAITARSVDWLIKPSRFEYSEPQGSDEIKLDDGRTFEVKAQPGLPCWEWSDPRHTFLRIHTIEQKTTA
jgi:hypothetical protein